jgi:hypothetical protein
MLMPQASLSCSSGYKHDVDVTIVAVVVAAVAAEETGTTVGVDGAKETTWTGVWVCVRAYVQTVSLLRKDEKMKKQAVSHESRKPDRVFHE